MDDHFVAALAVALAGKVAEGLAGAGKAAFQRLVDLVRQRFQPDQAAVEALAAAKSDPSDPVCIDQLRAALVRLAAADPAFGAQLRDLWRELRPHLTAASGGVVNTISGDVSGGVVQARDVQGGISFGVSEG